MIRPLLLSLVILLAIFPVAAQKNSSGTSKSIKRAVVIDGGLAVLRDVPGYSSRILSRWRRGREVNIIGTKNADGAVFVKVASGRTVGWIQREALLVRGNAADEARILEIVKFLRGYEQLQVLKIWIDEFPRSAERARMLLLFGDLAERAAEAATIKSIRKRNPALFEATGGPSYGYLLNLQELDRYRRLGIVFGINPRRLRLHYAGAAWKEVVARYPATTEAAEARNRLAELESKLRED